MQARLRNIRVIGHITYYFLIGKSKMEEAYLWTWQPTHLCPTRYAVTFKYY